MGTVEGAHNYYGFGTPDGDSSRGGSLAVGLYLFATGSRGEILSSHKRVFLTTVKHGYEKHLE